MVLPASAQAAVWDRVRELPPEVIGAGALGLVAVGGVALALPRGRRRKRRSEPSASPSETGDTATAPPETGDAAQLGERLARELGILSDTIGRLAASVADGSRAVSPDLPGAPALVAGVSEQVSEANRLLTRNSESTAGDETWLRQAEEATAGLESLAESAAGLEALLTGLCELSERTQLLAINAAIEAAKTGESGRGLARVAEDVRLMARDSRHAARRVEQVMAGTARCARELRELVASGTTFYRSSRLVERRREQRTGEAARLLTSVCSDLGRLKDSLAEPQAGQGVPPSLMAPELARVLTDLHGAARQLAALSERLSASLHLPD